uniref:Myb-like domain-containing protein n=1 Tax=Ditylenchus dipsaci TaxID=166011 RepID=A0A915EDK1_9BILA
MSRNSSDDWSLTEGIVKKQKRFRYTPLEERKMWHFFAHELRGGNPKAKFGPAIWEQYKQFNKETTKSTYGLESHFRKIMIPIC